MDNRYPDGGSIKNAGWSQEANYRKHIAVAAETMQYYAQVGKDITPTSMHWKTLSRSDIQWNALKDLNKQYDPDVLKLMNNGSIIKWIESFKFNLNEIFGVYDCPLVYVMHEQHDFLGTTCGTLLPDQPHSEEHGSAEVDMISITSHDHPLFRNDNGDIYDSMEGALSGSKYASTIVWFRKKQEGNEAF